MGLINSNRLLKGGIFRIVKVVLLYPNEAMTVVRGRDLKLTRLTPPPVFIDRVP